MMQKKSLLIFAVGAVACWTAAKRLAGDSQDEPLGMSGAWGTVEPLPAEFQDTSMERSAPGSETAGRDPFRDAFREAWTEIEDRKSTRLNSSHIQKSRMPSSA